MTIKLIALDMDGTVLDPQHTITPAVHRAIVDAASRGIKVVLTSGRPYIGMKKYIEQLGLDQAGQYCISYNGALVQSAQDGNTLLETSLKVTDYQRFEQLSRQLHVHFQGLTRHHLYTSNQDISAHTVHEVEVTGIPLRYRAVADLPADQHFMKLMMVDDPEQLDRAIAAIPAELYQDYTLVKSSDHYLEILDKKANKGAAIQQLAAKLSIRSDQVMAIGDHENDISMVTWAGCGVAMGNAIEKLKQQADYQTDRNDQDGVATAIKRFVLDH